MFSQFSEEEMETIRAMQARISSAEEIAAVLGVHRTTLERKLLKGHGIVLETVRATRLVPLAEFSAREPRRRPRQRTKPKTATM